MTTINHQRVAIIAKYIGNHKIRVWRGDSKYNEDPNRLTVNYLHEHNPGDNYRLAIDQYVIKAGLSGIYYVGGKVDGAVATYGGDEIVDQPTSVSHSYGDDGLNFALSHYLTDWNACMTGHDLLDYIEAGNFNHCTVSEEYEINSGPHLVKLITQLARQVTTFGADS